MAVESGRDKKFRQMQPTTPPVVVGVVGIGHAPGIAQVWDKVTAADVNRVVHVPPPTIGERVFRATFRLAFYSALAYGTYRIARGPIAGLVARIKEV